MAPSNLLILITSVMHLIKSWLTIRNVIIANDVLVQIEIFANSIDSSNALKDLAFDVLQCIADKVPFLLVLSRKVDLHAMAGRAEFPVHLHYISF